MNQALLRNDLGHAACNKVRAELQALEVASAKIAGECGKIRAEGNRLRAECDKLREKADRCWVEAVRSKFGNITMDWGDDGSCTLENGMEKYTELRAAVRPDLDARTTLPCRLH